ncbi:MAG TPA: transcriptional regulator [Planctomycetaceae bacterium]|nr:transcriptional regulator [Planctomycetaceae bacterium]
MPQVPRFRAKASDVLPQDLELLGRRIARLPEPSRSELMPIYERVVESFRLRGKILSVAKEALEQLRLELAFLQFDLEATRREKEALEQQRDQGDL